MLAMLGKEGAKRGEIEATGLDKFLAGKQSVTKDEIAQFLTDNRVGLKERVYADTNEAERQSLRDQLREARRSSEPNFQRIAELESRLSDIGMDGADKPHWSDRSLDPSNPTYRETVIHLPAKSKDADFADSVAAGHVDPDEAAQFSGEPLVDFHTGHFPEPNIVGHMMTSMTKHDGKPVFTLDQIQSDWGQKLRDGGVRDEAKIADLKTRIAELEQRPESMDAARRRSLVGADLDAAEKRLRDGPVDMEPWLQAHREGNARESYAEYQRRIREQLYRPAVVDARRALESARQETADLNLARAELRTAEASAPGHPLVNTTDQWTNTVLRRAIRQAVDAGAEYIAIPHGDTVLSYNPGDEHGMRSFYGSRTSEGIVPKNLRKLLEKIDRGSAKPVKVEKLETSQGLEGWQGEGDYGNNAPKNGADKAQTGFTLFRLTDAAKRHVLDRGMPVFSGGGRVEAPIPADTPRSSVLERALRLAGITKNKS